MKRMLLFGMVFLAAVLLPFSGTDVAKLQPVEVIRISKSEGEIRVETDTGGGGKGTDLASAFADLKETTAGEVFLETAEHLLISSNAQDLLPTLAEYLRPSCNIYIESGAADLAQTAKYLAAHESGVTLSDYRAGIRALPVLQTEEGRMQLVY